MDISGIKPVEQIVIGFEFRIDFYVAVAKIHEERLGVSA
jgi:hypothetical protein